MNRSLGLRFATLTLALATLVVGIPRAASAHGKAEADATQKYGQRGVPDEATRSAVDYSIPQVKLVRADGKTVWLADELNDGRPVVMDFIYTTCTSICPMSSQTLAELQKKLGAGKSSVHLVSISIDPENDTPIRLREYAKKFGASSEWHFYTGSIAASTTAQRAFNVFRGDKMSHTPVTLVRTAPSMSWVRIDGFVTAEQLLGELRDSVASASERHVQ